jgi:GR25 family glycosyltransferase involved in LPS biosynthesis
MNPFDPFDNIYCVNLPESTDRWNVVSGEFHKLGILDRVQRCAAQRPVKEIFAANADAYHNYPALGMVGCTLSHLKILVDALSRGFNRIFVFEDDVTLTDDAFERVGTALRELPETWDIFYLGGEPIAPLTRFSPNLVTTNKFWGSYAYGLNRKCLTHLCNIALDNISNTSWDGHLSIYSRNLEKYCVFPAVCKTVPGFSYVMDKEVDWNTDADEHWRQFAPV